MLKNLFYSKIRLSLLIPLSLITSCSEGNNNPKTVVTSSPIDTTEISNLTVNNLSEVIICFSQIQLKRNDADDLIFTVDSKNGPIEVNELCRDSNDKVIANTAGLNLLNYTENESINLITGAIVSEGNYSDLQVIMSDGSYGIDSKTGEKIKISVQGNQLKLDGFTVKTGGIIEFSLDFNLQKSMINPINQIGYFLKPDGIRLIDNIKVNHS